MAQPQHTIDLSSRNGPRSWPVVALIALLLICLVAAVIAWQLAVVELRGEARRSADATDAKQNAVAQAQLADDHFRLAMNAIESIVARVQAVPEYAPELQKIRRQLRDGALLDLQQLSARVLSVSEVTHASLLARLQFGDAYDRLGDTSGARKEWNAAADLASKILDNMAVPDVRITIDVARAWNSLGVLALRDRDGVAAERYFEQALQLLDDKAVAKEPRGSVENSKACSGLGDVCLQTARPHEALDFYKRSLRLSYDWLKQNTSSAFSSVETRVSDAQVGISKVCLSLLHDYVEAEWCLREQLEVAAGWMTQLPDDRFWQRNYLITLLDLSAALHRQCDYRGAESAARDALGSLDTFANGEPENLQAQNDAAQANKHLGLALMGQGQFKEAQACFEQAIERMQRIAESGDRIARISDELSLIWYLQAIVAQRMGSYREAEEAIARIESSMTTSQQSPDPMSVLSSMKVHIFPSRQALKIAAETIESQQRVAEQDDAVYESLAPIRILSLARNGDFSTARSESGELTRRMPRSTAGPLSRAAVDSLAAERAEDDTQRAALLADATTALSQVIQADFSLLEILCLLPEFTAVRSFAAFQSELEDLIANRYAGESSDPL